jgi:hypothetical protein
MEDVGDRIADKVQALSDIELAVLLCLVAEQHCIIQTEKHIIDDLDQEIRLVSTCTSDMMAYLMLVDHFKGVWAYVGGT